MGFYPCRTASVQCWGHTLYLWCPIPCLLLVSVAASSSVAVLLGDCVCKYKISIGRLWKSSCDAARWEIQSHVPCSETRVASGTCYFASPLHWTCRSSSIWSSFFFSTLPAIFTICQSLSLFCPDSFGWWDTPLFFFPFAV